MKLPIKNNHQYLLVIGYQDSDWGYEVKTTVIPSLDTTVSERSSVTWTQALKALYEFYQEFNTDPFSAIEAPLVEVLNINSSIEEIFMISLYKLADDGQDHLQNAINERAS